MKTSTKRVARMATGAALAVAATMTTCVSGATAAPARPLTDCFVTTVGVPAYDYPNRNIVVWVGQGQGLFLTQISGYWRKGNLWGGQSNVWIHSNYLRYASGAPC